MISSSETEIGQIVPRNKRRAGEGFIPHEKRHIDQINGEMIPLRGDLRTCLVGQIHSPLIDIYRSDLHVCTSRMFADKEGFLIIEQGVTLLKNGGQ